MQIEPLDYVPATRTLIDQNGLAVGRGVNPDDGARIIAAFEACRQMQLGNMAQVGPLIARASADVPRPAVPGPLASLLDLVREMLEFEADEFDGPADVDLHLSGADMIDAFTGWRTRLKAVLPLVMADRGAAA